MKVPKTPFQKPENSTWPQYVAVLTALLGMFCSGIHMGWPMASLPRLFTQEYPFNVSAEEASYITIIGPLGDVAGNVISSVLVDLIGRKITILLIGLPQLVSMTMIFFSSNSIMLLYFARFIGGISEGSCFTVYPLYICEVSEAKIRGSLGTSLSLILILGLLFANLVGSYVTIFTASLIYASCSVIFMISFSLMPESPYYLLMKEKIQEAESSLKKLRARNEVDEELLELQKDVKRQMSEKGRFRDLYKIQSNKMAMIVMIILRILQQFSGISPFTFYSQLLLREVTDSIPEKWAATLLLIIQVFATFSAVILVDRLGRKPMILISTGGCFLSLTFNTIFFALRDYTSIEVDKFNVLPLIGLIFFVVSFSLGLGSAVNLLLGELFPASVKAKAACMLNMIFAIGMSTSTKFYQFMTDTYSIMLPFAVFGVIQFVGFILCVKYVPETKNKTLEQIQQELKGNKDVK